MERIYSKKQPDLLLHVIFRKDDFSEGRTDVLSPDEFIQCAALRLKRGTTFRPHKHIVKEPAHKSDIAQESWHVLRGRVRCIFYDVDDTIIAQPVLRAGDTSFTLRGGHNYVVLSKECEVLEYKTGPYRGQLFDKTFIE